MRFLAGIITGVVLVSLLVYLVAQLGLVNMAASAGPNQLEAAVGQMMYESSLDRRAPEKKNPFAGDPQAMQEGLTHYKEMCIVCHGAPGIQPTEIGKGLSPEPPMLDSEAVQKKSDGELYWTVEHGIRMTGMPAFGQTHNEEEIWRIVAFVRQLPKLTEEQKHLLTEQAQHGH